MLKYSLYTIKNNKFVPNVNEIDQAMLKKKLEKYG